MDQRNSDPRAALVEHPLRREHCAVLRPRKPVAQSIELDDPAARLERRPERQDAIELRASDVHLEPFEDELRIRYRIDGVLQEVPVPAQVKRFQPAIVARVKILSHLNIAEKRLPQDGRIKVRIEDAEVDIRVSTLPSANGERFRAQAYVLGRQLRSDGVRVQVFRQSIDHGQWVDSPVSPRSSRLVRFSSRIR